jgi:cytochrome c
MEFPEMDSFELNKIAGAVLATLLVALGLNIFSGIIFAPRPAGDAGYPLPVPQEDAAPQGAAAPAPRRSLSRCSRQRRRGEGPVGGAQVRVLPFLREGRPEPGRPEPPRRGGAGEGGGAELQLLRGLKEKGGEWSFENINAFLQNPKGYAPGTTMAFAGIGAARSGRHPRLPALPLGQPEAAPDPVRRAVARSGG